MKRALSLLAMSICIFATFCVDASSITKPFDWSSSDAALVQGAFSGQSAVASFKQTKSLSSSPRKFVSTGSVQILPGTGMVWYTDKPYASVLAIGKSSLRQSIRGGEFTDLEIANNQVYVSISQCMDAMFSGNLSTLQSLFNAFFLLEGETWNLLLVPKDKGVSSFIDYIVMTGNKCLESLLIVEKGGDSVLYELSDLVYGELTDEEVKVFGL